VLSLKNCRIEGYTGFGLLSYYGRVFVNQCVLSGSPQSAYYGAYTYLGEKLNVDQTIILGNRGWGMVAYGTNVLLRNTVVGSSANGIYYYHVSGRSSDTTIWNCTVGNCPGYGIYQYYGRSNILNTIIASSSGSYALVNQNGNMYHANNLIYGYRQPYSGTAQGEGELAADPRFESPAAGNYAITANSAAINRGRDLKGQVDIDIVGVPRPVSKGWDIGAYEYPRDAGTVRVVHWQETR
jgi:hypothetical protein